MGKSISKVLEELVINLSFNSLKFRLLFLFGVSSLIILSIFGMIFEYYLSEAINKNILLKSKETVRYIKDILEANKTSLLKENHLKRYYIAIIKDKNLIKNKEFDLTKLLNYKEGLSIIKNPKDDDHIDTIYIEKTPSFSIILYQKNLRNEVDSYSDILEILIPSLFLILIFLANRMLDSVLTPINRLIKATEELSLLESPSPLPLPKREDEIFKLTLSFNQMIKRIKKEQQRIEQFNEDLSHELKTPLTVIKGEIDLSLRRDRDIRYYKNSLKTIAKKSEEIIFIIEQLLLISRYSNSTLKKQFQLCRLDKILKKVVKELAFKFSKSSISLEFKEVEKLSWFANCSLMEILFKNIIDNSYKYSSKKSKIEVWLYKSDKKVIFRVRDYGVGISEDKISKVTDRFFREDDSRSKNIKGYGLGLSIVKSILSLHNGDIKIDSQPQKGTEITISFY